jgi:hypothetical protein
MQPPAPCTGTTRAPTQPLLQLPAPGSRLPPSAAAPATGPTRASSLFSKASARAEVRPSRSACEQGRAAGKR